MEKRNDVHADCDFVRVEEGRQPRRFLAVKREVVQLRVQGEQPEVKRAKLDFPARAACDFLYNVPSRPPLSRAALHDRCNRHSNHNQENAKRQNGAHNSASHPPPPEGWTTIRRRAFASSSHCVALSLISSCVSNCLICTST